MRNRGLSLKSPGSFSGPESCFVFAAFTLAFTFKIKINNFENDKMKLSVNIHVTKLTGYYGLETVLLFNTFGFYNYLPLGPKSFQAFREMGHRRK